MPGKRSEEKIVQKDIFQSHQAKTVMEELFKKIPIGVCVINPSGIFEYVNPPYCMLHGYRPEELTGKHFTLIVPDELKEQSNMRHNRFFEKKTETRREMEAVNKQGQILNILMDSVCINGPDGQPRKMTFVINITGQKRLEKSLRDSLEKMENRVVERAKKLYETEVRFKELFDNMGPGVAVYKGMDQGASFVIRELNQSGLLQTGRKKEEVIGQDVRDVFPGVESMGMLNVLRRVWETGKAEYFPTTFYSDQKLESWFENYVYKLPSGELVAIYTDVTHQKRAEKALLESEEKYRSLVETINDWIWETDENGFYTYSSPKIKDILGYTSDEIIGKRPIDLVPKSEKKKSAMIFAGIQKSEKPFSSLESINRHKNGHLLVLEASGVPFFDQDNRLKGYRGIGRDVSEWKKYEETLLMTENVFTNTIEGIAVTDKDGIIQRINPAFTEITGYTEEEAVGQNPRILKSDRHDDAFYSEMWQTLLDEGQWSGEIWNRRKDGSAYPEWLSISAVKNSSGEITNFVSLFHDISEKKNKEEQLQFLAFHDPLTRLPNRLLLYDRIKVGIRNAKRKDKKMALLYMDIDDFKNINDSYGHPFGDEFLCSVKDRIKAVCRETDTFARYGGDEFVIVLNDILNSRDVVDFSNRIVELFNKPLIVFNEEVYSSLSIGIAVFPDDGKDIVTLEKNADMALYEAKKYGKRQSFQFKQKLKDKMLRTTYLENTMRRSIKDFSTFSVVYQPKVGVAENRIHSVEVLLRWHAYNTPVSPMEFIPIAEENGLIIPIGEWLMEKAMTDFVKIHQAGYENISISINLSAKQFNDKDLLIKIKRIMDKTGFDPSKLCFEITESIPMDNANRAIDIMNKINAMGIKLSMDDFGTGYSSLSVLKQFPLDELKIDRAFVKDLPENRDDAAISKTIIQMAKSLNLEVVAEGVETVEQRNFLVENECDLIQGYYYYKPLSYDDLIKVLQQGK